MAVQMMNQQAVGAALQARRHAVGLSREALAARAGGVSSSTVWRVEHGIVRAHPATLAALVRALERAERAAWANPVKDVRPAASEPDGKSEDAARHGKIGDDPTVDQHTS